MAMPCSSLTDMHRVALALGSNLGEKASLLRKAIALINEKVGAIESCSAFIASDPYGYESSNSYVNAALTVRTSLTPEALLLTTQAIEKALGRRHKHRKGESYTDRCCDIDILLYDELVIETDELVIPHSDMQNRDFVLAPLASIAPHSMHPLLKKSILQLYRELCK